MQGQQVPGKSENFNPISGLFFKSNSPKPSSSKDNSNKKIVLMMSTLAVSHAEIRWALKVLTSYNLFRSCLIFLDSDKAKSFQLWKTKCPYYIVHGLAPYFMEILLQEIRKLPTYSFLWRNSESSTPGRKNVRSDSFLELKTFWTPGTLPNLEVYQAVKCR